jgi:AraC family ethanolamine operon transcriptional activator
MPTQIRQLSSQAFQDVVEQAQAFTGWDVSYAQVSPGTYAGRIDAVQFAKIRLIRERSDQVVSQAGVGRKGHYVFGLCTTPTPGTRFNGRSWTQGIAATRGGREFCVRVDRNDMLMLEIEADTLEARLAISCEDRLDALFKHGACLFTDQRVTRRFTEVVSQWLNTRALQTLAKDAAQAQGELLDLLADVVSSDAPRCDAPGLNEANRVSLVNRAIDFVNAHIDQPLQVIDLCDELRVSRRTLQMCFQEVTGLNPVAFLRAHRLSMARHDIIHRKSPIKDVVNRWGFWHQSRFSTQYRELFGELPSATQSAHR